MSIIPLEILTIEGGLTNDVNDAGGLTKYGISQRSFPNVDIASLTPQQAMEIYAKKYWTPNRLGEIDSQEVANKVFYLVVNCGASTAIKIVQDALRNMGKAVKSDGVMGPVTLAAIYGSNPNWLLASITVFSCEYYLGLVDRKPSQSKFFKGWIRRALL